MRLLLHCAHEQQLTRVAAEVYASNVRSIRLLERSGFQREGVLRRSILGFDGWEDEYLYAMLTPERTCA